VSHLRCQDRVNPTPLTIAQAAIRSRSPIACHIPAITGNAVSRADSWAASSPTWLGILPKGPVSRRARQAVARDECAVPSSPEPRSKEMDTSGGSFGLAGSVSPRSLKASLDGAGHRRILPAVSDCYPPGR
jgi:hypothetical protein